MGRKPRTNRCRKPARKRQRINPILIADVFGIAAIVACFVMYYALANAQSSGILGPYIAGVLKSLFGVGAYLIPGLVGLIGIVAIIGPLEIIPRNIGVGSSILFFVVIGWASLDAAAEKVLDPTVGGGHIGNALAYALSRPFGFTPAYVVLIGAAAVAVLIIVDRPLAALFNYVQVLYRESREAARQHRSAPTDRPQSEKPLAARTAAAVAEPKPQRPGIRELLRRRLAKEDETGADDQGVEPVRQPEPAVISNEPLQLEMEQVGKEAQAEAEEQGEFRLPPTSLLADPPPPPPRVESELRENIEIIERTLREFKVDATVVEIAHGPTVARYEIRLAPGIRVNKIVGLADNLAMQLAAIDVRVEAPIPGKSAIGVEVPNKKRGTVVLKEVVESKAFREAASKLAFALGKDVAGRPVVADLAKMPHLLIGGATNAGKSVCLNSLIASLLFRATPDELKFIMIDPKRVELSLFDGIPHLACPVVKNVKQAAGILRAAVQEMERRYDLFARTSARNIDSYNEKIPEGERLPYIVIVVDELCDLMMQAAAEVEGSITRLAQLARATGIHLVIATQRPSVDVITGVIKANISSRIAFAVSSWHDSKTILDHKGAERLIGRGDMLFLPIDASKPTRIQGCYISEKEILALVDFLKAQRKPTYFIQPVVVGEGGGPGGDEDVLADEYYEPSVRYVVTTGYCSTSMLQRKFKIGYTRAARIVDFMEQQGIVGPLDGAGTKGRQVLITKEELDAIFGGRSGPRARPLENDDEDDGSLPVARKEVADDEKVSGEG
ncbi:MAG: DNA translocase FtsK 4TM domain-containing protein [Armatimonadota bacterium]|nr:DNA translocase FtsK 4TM domain-containing protein [Armatimonadota bacterium]